MAGRVMVRHIQGVNAPLRKITDHDADYDYLECGHKLAAAKDVMGNRDPERRRCVWCEAEGKS